MPNLPYKCVYHRTQPTYQEYYFQEYIGKRILLFYIVGII